MGAANDNSTVGNVRPAAGLAWLSVVCTLEMTLSSSSMDMSSTLNAIPNRASGGEGCAEVGTRQNRTSAVQPFGQGNQKKTEKKQKWGRTTTSESPGPGPTLGLQQQDQVGKTIRNNIKHTGKRRKEVARTSWWGSFPSCRSLQTGGVVFLYWVPLYNHLGTGESCRPLLPLTFTSPSPLCLWFIFLVHNMQTCRLAPLHPQVGRPALLHHDHPTALQRLQV